MVQQVVLIGLAIIASTYAQYSILPVPEVPDERQPWRLGGGREGYGKEEPRGQGDDDVVDSGQGYGNQGQRYGNQGRDFRDQRPSLDGSHTPEQGFKNSYDYQNPYNNRGQNRDREPGNVDSSSYGGRPNVQPPRLINDPIKQVSPPRYINDPPKVIQPPRYINDPPKGGIQPPRYINDPPKGGIQPPRYINDPPKPYNNHGPAPVQGRRPGGYNRDGGGYMIHSHY